MRRLGLIAPKLAPKLALKLALALALPLALPHAAWAQPPLDLLSPRPDASGLFSTVRDHLHLLGRTQAGALVLVGGEPVTVFATGVFARDHIPLAPGINRIRVEARAADGSVTEQLLEVDRQPPPAPAQWPAERLWLDGASLRPEQLHRLAPGEAVEVSLRATPGRKAEARLPGQPWQILAEPEPGRYRSLLRFAGDTDHDPAALQVRLSGMDSQAERATPLTALAPGMVGQWRSDPERLVRVGADGAALLHGLHEVRLGGPNLAELPAGTLLAVSGQRGPHLRVALAPGTEAWVAESAVTPAAPGTPRPQAWFTSISVSGQADGDAVLLALPAALPVAVRAVSDAAGRQHLVVDLFGAHHASTWITQDARTRVVREVSAEQAATGHVRLRVDLLSARLWGWRVERSAQSLRIVVRAAPPLTREASPLAGLRVALEAGHGGAQNLGAVGATGTPEKDINRWAAQALQAELEAAGAQVVMVREGDDNPGLRERADRVTASGAQLFLSLHANASDTALGYLRVGGTSTLYKHAHGRALAAAVQRRLLEQTGLDDFGLIGNFNYAPTRLVTWMPAVLVEQAFVSHPGDEARLLDPAFRALLARAVRQGIEDFLRATPGSGQGAAPAPAPAPASRPPLN